MRRVELAIHGKEIVGVLGRIQLQAYVSGTWDGHDGKSFHPTDSFRTDWGEPAIGYKVGRNPEPVRVRG